MSRNDHPNKEIRQAVDYALESGWRLEKSGGHAHSWGTLYCPFGKRGGCFIFVRSTPSDKQGHANAIRHSVDVCTHPAK